MSPRGPIDVDPDDLAPNIREKVERARARIVVNGIEVGPNSPLLAAAGAQRAQKRQRVGRSLEQEMELVHQLYEHAGRARIRKTHPPTYVERRDRKGPVLRYQAGGGGVDYTGTARVAGKARAIAFDLKSEESATYAHDPKQGHQLRELLDRQRFGDLAFLLIICAPMNVGYLIIDESMLRMLQLGRDVVLRVARFAGKGSGRRTANNRAAFDHLVPHFYAPNELLVRPDVPRWDWLFRLEQLVKGTT